MKGGISWRGRCRQEECYYNPNQSWPWMQSLVGCQARISRRAVNILGLFLIPWFVVWTLTRFRTPPSISTESVPRRAFVLELFWYSQARNGSFTTALATVHRRRQRGLLKTRALTSPEVFDEEEQEEQLLDGQVVGDDLTREFHSFKNRMGCHESKANPLEASSSTRAALRGRKWPVVVRESDLHLQILLAEVPIGYYGSVRNYLLIPDTASGRTWVNCQGSGLAGDTGSFFPMASSFLNCEEDQSLCKDFQGGSEYPCDEMNKFRCFFECKYADGSEARGSIIKADVRFDLSDAPGVLISMAFGCADAGKGSNLEMEDKDSVDEDDTMDEPTSDGSSDGVLGLSPHPSSWLRQLHSKGLVSEYVVTVCLDPARPAHDPRSPFFERAGFISFGDLYATQSASTIWTTSVVHNPTNDETVDLDASGRSSATYLRPLHSDRESSAMHAAELVGLNYRGKGIDLRSRTIERDNMVVRGVRMSFDTGAGLTYLHPRVFQKIDSVLKEDARRMKFQKTEDRTRNTIQRSCWRDKRERRKSLVREFGDLIMKFSSLADAGSTSDFVIKPEYYLTSWGVKTIRTCFNMREEEFDGIDDNDSACVLGGEAMRGHLLIFNEQSGQIGWSPVTTCDNLRSTS